VRDSLLRRGVAPETVEAAMKRVLGELDLRSAATDCARRFLRKGNVPSDPKTVHRLIAHLRQRGFDDESIGSVLERTVPAALLHRFEPGE
jgi:SOS response regulatory protein OraA/RecX